MTALTKKKNTIIDSFNLDIGKVDIYADCMVAELTEGFILDLSSASTLFEISNRYFYNKPFIYIAHRKNSYSVDPTMYLEVMKIDQLKGIAIVSSKEIDHFNFDVETQFFKKPMKIFHTLQEAFSWQREILFT